MCENTSLSKEKHDVAEVKNYFGTHFSETSTSKLMHDTSDSMKSGDKRLILCLLYEILSL